ncbi:MAG: bifunctional 2-acylglycerophosphoethanolamine acyltransferase/acyl-ACP synthetase, partial [Chloroflexi bacterium]|nr:bifunctional 2-acylglycerophosphoethanolamine acyltransferase/acyl-ACP synthetase [Chloroflexota bacterium]
LKRFAKVAGEMVSLEVVEALARAASDEAMHAATCVPDPGRGESIVLFTTDPALTREQLAQVARAHKLPEIALPRRIRVVESLPVLGTGKINYPLLKTWAEDATTT